MPYKLRGKTIYTKSNGRWKKKQTAKSVASAKRAMKLLYGIESGNITKSDLKKRRIKKKKSKR